MINANEFSGDEVCLLPGHQKVARFRVFPNSMVKKGTYTLGASILIKNVTKPKEFARGLEVIAVDRTLEFNRDYPSTPEEVKAFSAYLKAHPQE